MSRNPVRGLVLLACASLGLALPACAHPGRGDRLGVRAGPRSVDHAEAPATHVALPAFCSVPLAGEPNAGFSSGGYERRRGVTVGLGAGIVFAGAQDLKFRRRDAAGALTDDLFSADVDLSVNAIVTADATVWKSGGFFDGFGVRVDATRWSTRATAKSFVDRLGTSVPAPPFSSITQDRIGIFGSVLKRWSLVRGADANDAAYVYVGTGLGAVHTRASYGDSQWSLGAEYFAGVSVPVSESTAIRLQATALRTHDRDVASAPAGAWTVDTSGKHTSLLGHSTWDTFHYAVTLGVDFTL